MNNKDFEQDALIRENAEHIRRNEEAIERQTAALEKIRDHYFPRKTPWKKTVGWFLKVVGAVTLTAGVMESFEWYFNFRQAHAMADESARAAQRLFFQENDALSAQRFLEKAVELDETTVHYRVALTYVKGIVVLADLMNLERPLTTEERERNDEILSEAIFLQEVASDEPMPYVLAAQALFLRGESERSKAMLDQALTIAPDNAFVRLHACVMAFMAGEIECAKRQLAEVERLSPTLPILEYWKGMFIAKQDAEAAKKHFEKFLQLRPNNALGKIQLARMLITGATPDLPAARKLLNSALTTNPNIAMLRVMMSQTYEKEGNLTVARLWLTELLDQSPNNMHALLARAKIDLRCKASAVEDLASAIKLAPFRADLYDLRAKAYEAVGNAAAANADREMSKALTKDTSKKTTIIK